MKLFYCELDDSLTDNVIEEWVFHTKKPHIKRIKDKLHIKQSLIGDIMTRAVMSQYYGMAFREIDYAYNKYDKPYIPRANCHFNCSHSDTGVLVAFDNLPIGIDMEKMKHLSSIDAISEIVFGQSERHHLSACPPGHRLELFYKMWTIKESYVKLLGTGFNVNPDQIKINSENKNVSTVSEDAYPNAHYVCWRQQEYIFSIASSKQIPHTQINHISINELADYIEKQVDCADS